MYRNTVAKRRFSRNFSALVLRQKWSPISQLLFGQEMSHLRGCSTARSGGPSPCGVLYGVSIWCISHSLIDNTQILTTTTVYIPLLRTRKWKSTTGKDSSYHLAVPSTKTKRISSHLLWRSLSLTRRVIGTVIP